MPSRYDPAASPLLTDLYQLNMLQAYLEHGKTETAGFDGTATTLAGALTVTSAGTPRAAP